MSFDLETLYALLPAIYRIRDLEQQSNGSTIGTQPSTGTNAIQLPLKALLQVIAEQIGVLEENLAQLYDDQFIETCSEWVVPYIGDLVGYHTPHDTSSQSLRSDVAHTIGYRKRKGTATLLEQLVRDVTGWDAHVVELFQRMAITQHIHRPHPEATLVDLRTDQGEPLDRLNTPFDSLMHTGDIRTLSPLRGGYNIPDIGIFIWRLNAYSLTNVPATRATRDDDRRYFFSPLGHNLHLFTHPDTTQNDVTQLTGPAGVAMPISRSRLQHFLSDYYGRDKSILLTVRVNGENRDILPDPQRPSERLRSLIDSYNTFHNEFATLYQEWTTQEKLDKTKLQDLITKSVQLCNHLDAFYRELLLQKNRDLTTIKRLLSTMNELRSGLAALTKVNVPQLQKLRLEDLRKLDTVLYEGLQPQLDPQRIEDLITIADLRDRLKLHPEGTSLEKDVDSEGNALWENLPQDRIAIDPVLGRFAFPQDLTHLLERLGIPKHEDIFKNVYCTFYYGFSANMGGGEYHRATSFTTGLTVQTVDAELQDIQDTLDALTTSTPPQSGIVEIRTSGRVAGAPKIHAAAHQRIELRAADFTRPLLALGDEKQPQPMDITGEQGSWVTLNGLLISHGTLHVSGNLERLTLKHCTLVPGLSLSVEGKPQHSTRPSLIVTSPHTHIEIDHCIVGALRVTKSTPVHITNSIVDATRRDHVTYAGFRAADPDDITYGGPISIENSTIIGQVHTFALELASNTLFLAEGKIPVNAQKRQEGCMRFSYIPPASRVPQGFHCVPTEEEVTQHTAQSLAPKFASLRYGQPNYCQLLQSTPVSILQGADDEAEMGAFHDLFQSQRETNLRVRLTEYLSFTLNPEIIYIS